MLAALCAVRHVKLAPHLIGLGGEGEDVAAGPLEALGDGGQFVAEPVHQHIHQHHPAALTELHAQRISSPAESTGLKSSDVVVSCRPAYPTGRVIKALRCAEWSR